MDLRTHLPSSFGVPRPVASTIGRRADPVTSSSATASNTITVWAVGFPGAVAIYRSDFERDLARRTLTPIRPA